MAQKKPTQPETAASPRPQEQAAPAVPPAAPATGPVHVAYCIDVQGQGAAQFCDQLYVSVKSLRETRRPGDSIVVHVCYAHVSVELMERLHALDADGFKVATRHITDQDLAYWQQFTKHDPRSAARPWGGIVFARIWLPLLLPNVDRCIYLDADTMCRAPIADLCNGELPEGKWLGMNIGSVPVSIYEIAVAVTEEMSSGATEVIVRSIISTSSVKTSPAIGALKIPPIAPAAPQPIMSIIVF